ncbi:hypothetical protein KKI90_20010 [Xenorhabdus bovienii]|uniref:hypothetical protein n=1 Tax=Xenorhabdus bovienii TaxID=40576 RepID=UPI00237C9882|nr:hypothetical protein [Xenorhabdus bovienii]MDE1488551.1 hypothetical protein [Xenorhabdus bovienii]MDE1497052.1 hypothetical protein [Xenorhabdus bovienii]MDE9475106.1 hypothetical protein [Xenorhabdus bovienii]
MYAGTPFWINVKRPKNDFERFLDFMLADWCLKRKNRTVKLVGAFIPIIPLWHGRQHLKVERIIDDQPADNRGGTDQGAGIALHPVKQ